MVERERKRLGYYGLIGRVRIGIKGQNEVIDDAKQRG